MSKENTLSYIKKFPESFNKEPKLAIFQIDLKSKSIDWNIILKKIHEVPLDYIPDIENCYGNFKNVDSENKILQAHKNVIENDVSFELDYEIITAKGNSRLLQITAQPITYHGECISIYGIVKEINLGNDSSLQNIQLKHQLNYAEELAKSGSWNWNVLTGELIWSDNFYKIFNHSKSNPISYDVYLSYIHEDDKEEIARKFESVLETKEFPDSRYRLRLKDGTIKTLISKGKVVPNEKGEIITVLGACQDITERIAIKKELSHTNKQLKLTETINEAGTWQLNPSTGAFKWSDNLYKITDFESDQAISFEMLYARIHPDDKHHVDKVLKLVQESGIKQTFNHRLITKDGSVRTLEISADILSNNLSDDKVLIGTARNITNSIKIEHELIEINQLLDFAEHLTTMGYWRYKPETDDVFWSNNLFKMFDLPKTEQLSFSSYFNRIHPDDQAFVKERIDRSIHDNKFYDFTHRIVLSDSTIRIIQIIGKVTQNRNDGLHELLGTCLDVTDNESRELELSKKNQQLNVAEKMAMIGYWQWNTPTNEVFWSDNLHAIYGHDKQEPLTFETYINYVHEEDKKAVVANLKTAMKTGNFLESTYRIQLDDGSIKIIKSVGKITLNSKGEVLEMSGTCQDITIAKNNELELLKINQQLSLAEQMAMLGIWVWKPKKNIFQWSDSLYKIYGFELGSEVNMDKAISMIYPPDKDKVKEVIKNLLNGIEEPRSTYRIILNNNEIKTLEVRREISKDEHGNIELLGTTQDITHIVETEQLLKEKNHLLSFTEEMASMGSWQWNPHTGKSKWSDNLYKLYDLELGISIDMDLFLSRIHPEDSEKVVEHIEHIVSTQKSETLLSYRIILNDNSIRSLELMAEVVKDSNDQMIELIGTAQDVTDRIKREQDLLEKNQLLNFAEQLSSIGYWKWDIVNDVMEKSENLLKILDFDQETKLNFNTYINRVHPADREKVIDVSRKIIKTKKFDKFHHRIIKNDNSIRSIILIGEVILDSEGKVIELIGSSQDITEQIEAQKKIMNTNRSLEKSTTNLTSKNKQLAEFNHITSHNLRSPVSNLNALLGLYKSTKNESKKVEIFGKFEIVIDHLTETLNALIETISIKHSAVEITQELCFEQTLLKTKEILAAELIESNANIRCDFSKAKNVKYNPIYLESIFLNLVSNSLKYRSEDRVPEISITSNTVNGRTTLEFEDNGLGIDMKSNGHKLFGLNKVFHKHPDAKGIGLFLTKAQIIAMGGSISAKSKVDVGTTFFIILN
ncbi:PAS domain-containing protein [uncultured Maribacter sp.]|uniref:PAS domain-containing protein n=1 Tax=uncultured Maribacter sp. TaxID=431308 RepID=UPI00261872B3|nr:PAS domain-containing protein [uncultured Maribacter sp.]